MKEVKIINDVYNLMKWYGLILQKFPRNHRYGLGLRIENTIYDIVQLLNHSYLGGDKKNQLVKANANVQTLRLMVRLSWDLNLISEKQHHAFIEQIDNIGKQVGGWIKSLKPE